MVRKISPIFDTSVFSDYGAQIDQNILSCLFTTVVLYELVASSIDEESFKRYERWRILLSKNNLLLNPTPRDWWETSRALRRLYLMRGAQPTKLRTLRNDALLARLAVVHNGYIVTYDVDDFQLIQKVMPNLKIKSAQEFFES